MPAADGLATNCTDLHGLFKYSACGRKEFATEAQKHGSVTCISSVFQCLCGNINLPQANHCIFPGYFIFFFVFHFQLNSCYHGAQKTNNDSRSG